MSAPLPAIAAPTLVGDQVYEAIERAIFTGQLPGGSRLRVRDLAEMAGTSVMPVRDAIRGLEEAGLVIRTPHKGAVVREFTLNELLNIYQVRAILETEGARLGAAHVTDEGVKRMQAALDRMEAAVQDARVADALDADEDLLRVVYQASGNPVLVSMIETLWKKCRLYKLIGASAAIENDDNTLWQPQPAILAAAAAHDTAAAVEATEQSLLSARKRLEDRLHA